MVTINPGNTIRPFEYIVLVLVAINSGIATFLALLPNTGVVISPFIPLLLAVVASMIPVITNRLDALGQPQGASYVQLIDHEGEPVELPPPNEPLT